jgi:hypothetical protein
MTKINETNRTDVGHLTNDEIDAVSGGMIGYHEEDPQNPKRPDAPKPGGSSNGAEVLMTALFVTGFILTAGSDQFSERG